jgi:hypothetical protein
MLLVAARVALELLVALPPPPAGPPFARLAAFSAADIADFLARDPRVAGAPTLEECVVAALRLFGATVGDDSAPAAHFWRAGAHQTRELCAVAYDPKPRDPEARVCVLGEHGFWRELRPGGARFLVERTSPRGGNPILFRKAV